MRIALNLPNRTVEFNMLFDPGFIADANTRYFLERDGACEPEVVHLMNRALRPGDLAFDVGANVGFFTLLMASLVGPTGKVLAFEPGLSNLLKLDDNLAASGIKNVELHGVALSDEAGEAMLHLAADSGLHSLVQVQDSISQITVPVATLDSYCTAKVPRLVKIDVEGSEEKVLWGAIKSLPHIRYIVCELNSVTLPLMGASIRSIRRFMADVGYSTYILHTDGALPTCVPENTRLVSDKRNLNVLFSTSLAVAQAWPEIAL